MKFKKYKKISASYFDSFRCINSKCEFTCCGGWIVAIDKYKYRVVSDAIAKSNVDVDEVLSIEKDKSSGKSFGKLNLRNRFCPLLTSEYLCSLQKELGNDGLPVACATFPRIFNRVNNNIIMSARVSCIEVARLVLLDKKGLDLTFKKEESFDISGNFEVAVELDVTKKEFVFYNDLVIEFLFSLLKTKKRGISDRVKYVILFVRELTLLKGSPGRRGLKSLFNKVKDLMEKHEGINFRKDVNFQHDFIVGNIVPEHLAIIEELNVHGRYKGLYDVFKTCKSIDLNTYEAKLEKFEAIFDERYGYILRNFLLNFILNEIFPFKSGNIRYEAFRFTLNFAILKFLFIISIEKGSDEDFAQIVFQYSRIFGNVEIPKLKHSFFTNSDEVFDLLSILC